MYPVGGTCFVIVPAPNHSSPTLVFPQLVQRLIPAKSLFVRQVFVVCIMATAPYDLVVHADDRLGPLHDELLIAAALPNADRVRAAMDDSFAENATAARRTMRQRRSLQTAMGDIGPGAGLDVSTPVDGSW